MRKAGELQARRELEGQILGDSKKIRETRAEEGAPRLIFAPPGEWAFETRAKGLSWGARSLFATFPLAAG